MQGLSFGSIPVLAPFKIRFAGVPAGLTVAHATKEDVSPVSSFTQKIEEDEFGVKFAKIFSKFHHSELGKIVANKKSRFLVVKKAGSPDIAGSAILAPLKVVYPFTLKKDVAVVTDVYIAKSDRGKGLGKELMEQLVAEAQTQGYSRVLLFSKNPVAIALYNKIGFKNADKTAFNRRLNLFSKTVFRLLTKGLDMSKMQLMEYKVPSKKV